MKMILKLATLPILLVLTILCLLGNLTTHAAAFAFNLLLLVIVGSGIYCIVQEMWESLAILAGMGLVSFLLLFALVAGVYTLESGRDRISGFLRSRG